MDISGDWADGVLCTDVWISIVSCKGTSNWDCIRLHHLLLEYWNLFYSTSNQLHSRQHDKIKPWLLLDVFELHSFEYSLDLHENMAT